MGRSLSSPPCSHSQAYAAASSLPCSSAVAQHTQRSRQQRSASHPDQPLNLSTDHLSVSRLRLTVRAGHLITHARTGRRTCPSAIVTSRRRLCLFVFLTRLFPTPLDTPPLLALRSCCDSCDFVAILAPCASFLCGFLRSHALSCAPVREGGGTHARAALGAVLWEGEAMLSAGGCAPTPLHVEAGTHARMRKIAALGDRHLCR